ncbi:hypothetical protein, partial [Marinobacter halodurans]|uniref:hypothetical protein n=1 Tax=Marinobacter halodurans TaxID=2528979 RepID=UPI001A955A8C
AARATLDLNDALYCLRFLLMILLLVEMMNQSSGTCPNFGVHFNPVLYFPGAARGFVSCQRLSWPGTASMT